MAGAIAHSYVSLIPDDPVADAEGQITPTRWNNDHVIDALFDIAEILSDHDKAAHDAIGVGVQLEKLWFTAESFYPPITNPASLTEEAGSGVYAGQSHIDFDDTTAEHIVCRGPIIDYDGGNMTITMTAKPTTTPGGAVTLIFDIYAVGIADSEAYDAAATVDTGVDITFNFTTSTLQTDMMTATTVIDPSNVADGEKLVLEFIRNVATDTLVGDGEIIDFTIEYGKA